MILRFLQSHCVYCESRNAKLWLKYQRFTKHVYLIENTDHISWCIDGILNLCRREDHVFTFPLYYHQWSLHLRFFHAECVSAEASLMFIRIVVDVHLKGSREFEELLFPANETFLLFNVNRFSLKGLCVQLRCKSSIHESLFGGLLTWCTNLWNNCSRSSTAAWHTLDSEVNFGFHYSLVCHVSPAGTAFMRIFALNLPGILQDFLRRWRWRWGNFLIQNQSL